MTWAAGRVPCDTAPVRIAISGAQRVGKSTLVEELADALPGHEALDEPYWALADEGYDAAHPPEAEDFEAQLRRSIADIASSTDDVIFDRCPIDFLAYLEATGHDPEPWIERSAEAMGRLDLVVHVPIETPDRISVEADEDLDQRAAVDDEIARLLDDVTGVAILTVSGTPADRLAQILAKVTPRE